MAFACDENKYRKSYTHKGALFISSIFEEGGGEGLIETGGLFKHPTNREHALFFSQPIT